MTDFASRLSALLGLTRPPVAVAFRDEPPESMQRIDQPAVSGCTYWKLAADGRSFYTEAEDHYGCPIGSYTHGIDLPAEKQQELQGLMETMFELEYLAPEEVAGIPRRGEPFRIAMYAPLDSAPFEPDVILVVGKARQMMVLAEAAHAAGVENPSSVVGRPTCAAVPAVIQSGRTATNLGCIGNRVYTELEDDELYFAIPGSKMESILARLEKLSHANRELEKFHAARMA